MESGTVDLAWFDPAAEAPLCPLLNDLEAYRKHREDMGRERERPQDRAYDLRKVEQVIRGCDFWDPADIDFARVEFFLGEQQELTNLSVIAVMLRIRLFKLFAKWLVHSGRLPAYPPCEMMASELGARRLIDSYSQRKGRCYVRAWHWLRLYETADQPSYANLALIIDDWNARSDARRKKIDVEHGDRLPVETAEDRQRSTSLVWRAIARARGVRDGEKSISQNGSLPIGSRSQMLNLWLYWRRHGLPDAEIHRRWDCFPRRLRIAVAGRSWKDHRILPAGARGTRIVRQRLRLVPESGVSRKLKYLQGVRDKRAGWHAAYQHWDWELSAEERRAIDPDDFAPVGSGRRLSQLVGTHRRRTNGGSKTGLPAKSMQWPSWELARFFRKVDREAPGAPKDGRRKGLSRIKPPADRMPPGRIAVYCQDLPESRKAEVAFDWPAKITRDFVIRGLWMARIDEDPAKAMEDLRSEPGWEERHHWRKLHQTKSAETYHSPSAIRDHCGVQTRPNMKAQTVRKIINGIWRAGWEQRLIDLAEERLAGEDAKRTSDQPAAMGDASATPHTVARFGPGEPNLFYWEDEPHEIRLEPRAFDLLLYVWRRHVEAHGSELRGRSTSIQVQDVARDVWSDRRTSYDLMKPRVSDINKVLASIEVDVTLSKQRGRDYVNLSVG